MERPCILIYWCTYSITNQQVAFPLCLHNNTYNKYNIHSFRMLALDF